MVASIARPRLTSVLLLLRDLGRGVAFYRDGLGLKVKAKTDSFARVETSTNIILELKQASSEAQCSSGYSPFLSFEIDDMDSTIPRLITLGASLDGAIKYQPYGKVAAVRSPDGHMLALLERANLPRGGDDEVAAAAAAKARVEKMETTEELS